MSSVQLYEKTIGDTNYLVKTFEGGQGLINYQLQMLCGNEIKNIIATSKRQQNNNVKVMYNIDGKKSFADAVADRKISKSLAINFIKGTIRAFKELEEYQLATGGIVFDLQYIYVNDKFEPEFVYVPNTAENTGLEQFKQVLKTLIVDGKFEMTSDNFIQRLLEAVNKPNLRIADLKSVCDGKNTAVNTGMQSVPKPEPIVHATPASINNEIPQAQNQQIPQGNINVQNTPAHNEISEKKIPTMPNGKPIKGKKEKEQVSELEVKESKAGGGKKVLFIALQIVLVAALAGLFVSGLFTNEDGSINIQYLLGGLIGVAAVDFIVYREMFVNNKSKDTDESADDEKPAKQKKTSSKAKKPAVSMPGKDIPGKQPSQNKPNIPGKSTPNKPVPPKGNKPQISQNEEAIPKQVVHNPIPTPNAGYVQQPAVNPTPIQMDEYAEEGTVVLDDMDNTVVMDENSDNAYLEYYENGLSTKFYLKKERTIIGKLRSQCDYSINNNKISKIHAEFIKKGNEYFVRDCNSTNGTYLNGGNQRIQSNVEYPLYNGDRVTIANVDLTFIC